LVATSIPARTYPRKYTAATRSQLSWVERVLFAVAIVEIPLGIDAFLMYSQADADLGAVGGLNVSIATMCFGMLYVFWAMDLVNRELKPRAVLFGIPLVLYLASVVLSMLAAERPFLALCDLCVLTQAYAMFFYIANRINTTRDLVFCVCCLAGAMLAQGFILVGQRGLGAVLYGQRLYVGPISLTVWEDGRTAGTLVTPTTAGSWMAIVWLVVLSLVLTVKDKRLWWFLAGSLFVGLLGMLFTQTRGAIISVALGAIVIGMLMFVRGWLPRWTLPLVLFTALASVIPILQIVQNRVVSGDEGSAESRTHLSAIAIETIAKNPIFGFGSGNCHLACLPVANGSRFRSEWYYTIHCKYLLVWIETGILGLICFTAVLVNGWRYGIVTWFQNRPSLSPLGLGCTAAIAGHMVHMIVDIFNSRPHVQTLWVVLGISAAAYRLSWVSFSNKTVGRGNT
jgi:O-antigen ligase